MSNTTPATCLLNPHIHGEKLHQCVDCCHDKLSCGLHPHLDPQTYPTALSVNLFSTLPCCCSKFLTIPTSISNHEPTSLREKCSALQRKPWPRVVRKELSQFSALTPTYRLLWDGRRQLFTLYLPKKDSGRIKEVCSLGFSNFQVL